ncbi:MAG TPA: UDP-glucose 4-epimerase GalE [Dehalococcoidia bacterium]|nr:UDP-glucose 4-epimerase GalE [Dehalococcoidia bacterium]
MRILVAGGAGYIGSVTVQTLLDAGHSVTVYDDLSHGHQAAVDTRAQLVEGALQDIACLTAAFASQPFDAVLHFAAYIEVAQSMSEPGRYFANNVGGTISLINTAVEHGVQRFVFSSTAAVYGPPAYTPIDEQHPLVPINVYGQGKLMVEQMLAWYGSQCGLRSISLRYFNASGATETLGEDHEPESHLIPNLLAVPLGRRDHVDVFGDDYSTPDGTCIRDYVHVIDLAGAHLLALERTERAGGVYNLGTGNGYSVRQVLDATRRATGHPIPADVQPRRAGDPAVLVASAALAERELGWRPQRSGIDRIVGDAWRWHAAHPRGYDSSTTAS